MSCRYYLFPINNIYASVLYACYLFSRQIIYLFFLLWAYCNVIDSCCREIICLYKISEIIPSPSLSVFFSSTDRNINRNVIGSTYISNWLVIAKWGIPGLRVLSTHTGGSEAIQYIRFNPDM